MATSEDACREYRDNTLLTQISSRLKLDAIANAVRKTVRAYRSKESNKFFAVADTANGVRFGERSKSSQYSFDFYNMFCYIVYFIFNIVFR